MSCLQPKGAVGVAHSSAICMFARAGAAGATRDGAWKDCTKVVARTCHSSQERTSSAEVALWRLRRHGSAHAAPRGNPLLPCVLPCSLCCRGEPRSSRADTPACLRATTGDLVVNSYISAMDMRSVVVLALCGVCSAYQATTARTGALANQVTMMAKSKARPRSRTRPQRRAALCQASNPAAHTETHRSTGRADVRCA